MDCDACLKQGAKAPAAGVWWCDSLSAFYCDSCKEAMHKTSGHSFVRADEDEEDAEEVSEEEAFRWMQQHEEDPQTQCARLFYEEEAVAASGREFKWLIRERRQALLTRGFVVVDGFISSKLAAAVRATAESWASAGEVLRPASLSSAADASRAATQRGDLHAFLHSGKAPCQEGTALAELLSQLESLQGELSDVLRLRGTDAGPPEFQLALYPKSEIGYEKHRDAMPDDGRSELQDGTPVLQRRVTAIVYTSEGWCAAEGGQLKLWLSPAQHFAAERGVPGAEPFFALEGPAGNEISIAPVAGRLLLFLSGAVDHSVLPCTYNRTAVTAWFH